MVPTFAHFKLRRRRRHRLGGCLPQWHSPDTNLNLKLEGGVAPRYHSYTMLRRSTPLLFCAALSITSASHIHIPLDHCEGGSKRSLENSAVFSIGGAGDVVATAMAFKSSWANDLKSVATTFRLLWADVELTFLDSNNQPLPAGGVLVAHAVSKKEAEDALEQRKAATESGVPGRSAAPCMHLFP